MIYSVFGFQNILQQSWMFIMFAKSYIFTEIFFKGCTGYLFLSYPTPVQSISIFCSKFVIDSIEHFATFLITAYFHILYIPIWVKYFSQCVSDEIRSTVRQLVSPTVFKPTRIWYAWDFLIFFFFQINGGWGKHWNTHYTNWFKKHRSTMFFSQKCRTIELSDYQRIRQVLHSLWLTLLVVKLVHSYWHVTRLVRTSVQVVIILRQQINIMKDITIIVVLFARLQEPNI